MKIKTIGLCKSLGVNNNAGLQGAISEYAKTKLGMSEAEFAKHWRLKNPDDLSTLRQYMQPSAEALFEQWKTTRDPAWLYSHPNYKWDSLGVSTCQTHATTCGGIKLLRDNGFNDPKRIFDWGAGPGFSSIILAKNFPNAEVHYCEINAELVEIFKYFKNLSGLTNLKHVPSAEGKYDVIQAYEIVEHIAKVGHKGVGDVFTELDKVLAHATDDAKLLHASCWSAENRYFTLGHFLTSDVDGKIVKNTRVGKPFRDGLNKRGWNNLGHGWNARPWLFSKV